MVSIEKKMKTHELLMKIREMADCDPRKIQDISVADIVSSIYVELYGLRQLYEPAHFDEVEKIIEEFTTSMCKAQASGDGEMFCFFLDQLITLQNVLPDGDWAQDFIERANFEHAFIEHNSKNTLIVLGDSHVNFFSGNEELSFIPIGNEVNTCEQVNGLPITVLHLGPSLAYNSDRYGTSTGFRERLDWLMESFIKKHAKILCSLGEIDMRAHVYKQVKLQERDYREIVEDVAEHYMNFLRWLKGQGYEVYCWGPIASQNDSWPMTLDHQRVGTVVERNMATAHFNHTMKNMCEKSGIGFLTVFEEMIDDNMETKKEYMSSDLFHLGQHSFDDVKGLLNEMNLLE